MVDLVDWNYPRGRDTSRALTHVRTVLSRAETALDALEGGYLTREDPDADNMAADIREVCDLLNKWRRTGRTLKY